LALRRIECGRFEEKVTSASSESPGAFVHELNLRSRDLDAELSADAGEFLQASDHAPAARLAWPRHHGDGHGRGTATTSQISADKANPVKAAISSQKRVADRSGE